MADTIQALTQLALRIKSLAGASTADLIGIAPADQFSAEEFGELGQSFGAIRSIIVLAQRIIDPVQVMRFFSGEVHSGSPLAMSFGDAMLRNACWEVMGILREAGYEAAVPRNLRYGKDGPKHGISFKKAGVLAGVGSFGRNQLLIHPEWGPWMHLLTVVTNALLPPDGQLTFSPCEGCAGPCITACPTGALSASGIDRERCLIRGTGYTQRLSPHGGTNCDECRRACVVGAAPPPLAVGARESG